MTSENKIITSFNFWQTRNWVQAFYDFDIGAFRRLLREKGEEFWQTAGERRALKLFHLAAERVPAYKDFLKKHRIAHQKVRTIKDFAHVPITDKKNYIQHYPLEARCWDGKLSSSDIIAVSSGTTGEPTFWPRGGYQEFEAAIIHELLYTSYFEIDRHSTLLIIAFPLGVYVSGVATLLPSWLLTEKGYPMSVMSVGTNKSEVLKSVNRLQSRFDQIVLAGHPLAVKDVIETGRSEGIRWSRTPLRLMFCSEDFTEGWRRYLAEQVGRPFQYQNLISTYGSSELLLMAWETPLSILVRQLAVEHPEARRALVGDEYVPNMFQYNQLFRYAEEDEDELIFTSASGVPLIRYNLHDSGCIVPYRVMQETLTHVEPHWKARLRRGGWHAPLSRLPFLCLKGRSDHTIIFQAANIYPEHVRLSLHYRPFLKILTGKFAMRKGYLKNMDEYFEVNIELKKGVNATPALARLIRERMVHKLKKLNLEYRFISQYDKDTRPRIKLWPYQHQKYFKPGLKPRYIVKE